MPCAICSQPHSPRDFLEIKLNRVTRLLKILRRPPCRSAESLRPLHGLQGPIASDLIPCDSRWSSLFPQPGACSPESSAAHSLIFCVSAQMLLLGAAFPDHLLRRCPPGPAPFLLNFFLTPGTFQHTVVGRAETPQRLQLPGQHTLSPGGSIRHGSKCCCEGILQKELKSQIIR